MRAIRSPGLSGSRTKGGTAQRQAPPLGSGPGAARRGQVMPSGRSILMVVDGPAAGRSPAMATQIPAQPCGTCSVWRPSRLQVWRGESRGHRRSGASALTVPAVLLVVITARIQQNHLARKRQSAAMSYLRDIMRRLAASRPSAATSPPSRGTVRASASGPHGSGVGPDPMDSAQTRSPQPDDEGALQPRASHEPG